MNLHGFLDVVSITMGSLVMPKFFREGLATPPIDEHISAVDVTIPDMNDGGEWELEVDSVVGQVDVGLRMVKTEPSPGPVIIYHHGASETPADFGFNKILVSASDELKADLVFVRAPFHRSMRDFRAGTATLANWMAMIAVSVRVIESVIDHLTGLGWGPVTVSGTSLGGFVSNLHKSHFATAGAYVPIMAGTRMDAVILDSPYRRALPRLSESEEEQVREALDFSEGFASAGGEDVYPLLALHDEIVKYDLQRDSYVGCPVSSFAKGHTTGALAFTTLRRHILEHMAR